MVVPRNEAVLSGAAAEPLVAVLRRDRDIILSGLVGVTALAWLYLLYLAWGVQTMDMGSVGMGAAMPQLRPWTAVDFVLMFLMWAVMMVAMMVPTAAPMILTFAAIRRKRHEQQGPFVPTSVFVLAYMVIWAGFSALATLANWALHRDGFMTSMTGSTLPLVGGFFLAGAGVFQWTPLKHACLRRCRTPLGFLMTEWREGRRGAFIMGLRHGTFCVVCCWALMALLFVLGVMNLVWVAALAAFVLLEKVAPSRLRVSHVSGTFLIVWGAWMIGSTIS